MGVGCGSRDISQVPDRIVIVSVRDRAGGIGQESHASVAVIAVEALVPGTSNYLVLANEREAVRVDTLDSTALRFLEHLRIASWVLVIHKVGGRHPGHGDRDTVPVAVIDNR